MKLLSLFSGIGAFEKALDNLGIKYELTNYCEIDKYASKSYSAIHNVSESKNLWDITKVDLSMLPQELDLITYGFPCQDISLAGKQQGFFRDDGSKTRSGLFFNALGIIEHCQPKIAIAENVKALTSKKFAKEFKIVLDSLNDAGYNNYYKVLNSKDFGVPQNRERVFIVSIRKDIDNGLFQFPLPFELGVTLKDLLETDVDEKYFLSHKMVKYIGADNEKWTGNNDKALVNKSIASTLNTGEGHRRCDASNYICDDLPQDYNLKNVIADYRYDEGLRIRKDNLCPTLPATHLGTSSLIGQPLKVTLCNQLVEQGVVKDGYTINHSYTNGLCGKNENSRQTLEDFVETTDGTAPCLTTRPDTMGVAIDIPPLRIRKLTPKECFRLMGFSDADLEKAQSVGVSNAQLYKQAGNSIVVDVLVELLKNLFDSNGNINIKMF